MSTLRSLLMAFVVLPVAAHAYSLGEPHVRGGVAAPPVVRGDFVYAPSGISFEIWDLSDAAHPAKIPFELAERAPGPIFALAVVGDYLYAAWSNDAETSAGFEIYSLADPAHPVRVGEAGTTPSAMLVADGDYLYEIDGTSGVTVLDVGDPLHPVVAGSATGNAPLPQSIYSAEIARNQLYVSGTSLIETAWATIFDLADPAHPLVVGGIGLGAFGVLGPISDSGYAVAFGDAAGVYDVRDPAHIEAVGTIPALNGFARGAFRGDDLYLFGDTTLPVFDVSTPAAPAQIGEAAIDTGNLIALVPLPDGFLATTVSGRGLVIDASAPATPVLRSEIDVPSPSPIVDAALDDRSAYVIGEGHALEVVDAASLENVGVLEASTTGDPAQLSSPMSIGLSGSTPIVADYGGLFAIDVSDRANPRIAGSLPIGFYNPVLVAGDRAYVSTFDGALTIVDVSDPAALAVRGTLPGIFFTPLAAAGSRVFAFGTDLNLVEAVHIVDASDAAHPSIVGRYVPCVGTVFQTLAASSDGSTIGIQCGDGGVEIVDARNPATPVLASTYRPSDPADGTASIAANGSTFYLGNAHGIDELDASDPAAPVLGARHPLASSPRVIRFAPNGSLLALTSAGMYVFDCVASSGERPAPCRDGAAIVHPPRAHSLHGSAR